MARVKLQYSIICQRDEGAGFKDIIHGFRAGAAQNFYIANKWVWDDGDKCEDGFFQLTEIIKKDEVIAFSRSDTFMIKLAHTHHNRFKGISFDKQGDYRIRVRLFDRESRQIEDGSLEYPVFIR